MARNTMRKFSSKSLSLKRLTDNLENDEEYKHLPSEFCYPEERLDENSDETSVEESLKTESQEEIEVFSREQKSANTLKYTHHEYQHPVARYMKDIGKNVKVENFLPPNLITSYVSSLRMSSRRTNESTSQIPSPVFSEVSKDI